MSAVQRLSAPAEVIAHRGASAHVLENTFAAFDLALAQGADVLELDVRVTADGRVVAIHDPTLLRTTGDLRPVGAVSSRALRALDAAVRPPTLDAVLDRYARSTRLCVDLKDPTPAWELEVATALTARGLEDRVVVQSFDEAALRRVRRAAPALAVAPLLRLRPSDLRLGGIARFAAAVGVRRTAIDGGLLRAAHALGLPVMVWTADDPQEIERLLALGVDGVITNAPGVARAVVDGFAAVPAAA
jgi:glycerophosphoryl diester phosphodiesterase